jgi:hypothetical protein
MLAAIRVTLNDPALLNTCVTVGVDAVAPLSENVHLNMVGEFVLVLVNVIVAPCFTEVGELVKEATGLRSADTKTDFVAVELPAAFPAANVTVYVPAVANLCVALLPDAELLSPKFHDQDAGELVLASVKVKVVAVVPDVGDTVNEATGFTAAVLTTTDFMAVELPAPFVAVNVTLYVPAVANMCETF